MRGCFVLWVKTVELLLVWRRLEMTVLFAYEVESGMDVRIGKDRSDSI